MMDSKAIVEAENVPRQVFLCTPARLSGINCLPVEILALIFIYVAESTTSSYSRTSTRAFPFNVASTCPFWMDILKSNPTNWKSVSIDVMDPSPFLDTLTMFTGGPIEVFVFSSIKEAESPESDSNNSGEDAQKRHENLQAHIIFRQLEPHIKRCASITFDLIFQSSLPCATSILSRSLHYLEKLILKCLKHDVDDNKSMIEIYIDCDELAVEFEIPVLKEISLPGYSFMQLSEVNQGLLMNIGGEKRLSLSINQLTLQKHGIGPHNDTRTFAGFMNAIDDLDCNDLTLSNLTFGYRPERGDPSYALGWENVKLENVSPEFISTFFWLYRHSGLSVRPAYHAMFDSIHCSADFG
ncbi:hypothetical protein HYPSUDRAFT_1049586 [Hypholoma sublateritium FD-334 SS-4]|uniref:F-box domain-containing protein n=1 Tax=Hypholoma sublateritium (strain FD-334 SS-4) TaxID=945553 RepID=A0A0D2M0Y0_HYPSF|nr:hypothetical protein HYPSUDRAFT_1049586 [Hypholoma sublateritium FD-334 SS-4]